MTTFYIVGDLHVGDNSIYNYKKPIIKRIISAADADKNAIVCVLGDNSNSGYGKATFLCFPCLCMNTCSSTAIDEVGTFIEEVYNPLAAVNKNVFVIEGNHDQSTDNMSYPMLTFIQNTYNSTASGCYTYKTPRFIIVFLGKYPDASALQFFELTHQSNKDNLPYIVMQHYNFVGKYSDFWSDAEKNTFYRFCDNKNILFICHGHIHISIETSIQTIPSGKTIPVFCGSDLSAAAKIVLNDNFSINFSQF